MTIRTRIAPSPTGTDIHIGNLYTALINWAVAQKAKRGDGGSTPTGVGHADPAAGAFVVRIEDTDRTRYVEGAEARILQSLAEFGIANDEGPNVGGPYGPYRQSERLELYKTYAYDLVQKGKAYFSFASKEQLEEYRKIAEADGRAAKDSGQDAGLATRNKLKQLLRQPEVASFDIAEAEERMKTTPDYTIRLLVPDNTNVTFSDLIRGEITINTNQIDDQVLLKSDGYPTYHLAVVVDDNAMKITHIIRAEEWISSTPKHILLYDAFGWERPTIAHVNILRNPDKSKLSKRKNPVWAHWFIEQGYLPAAMLNYLALMGWSHPEQKEIFSLDEFVQVFDLKDVSPVGPVFDIKKLEWMNGMYIRQMSVAELTDAIMAFYTVKSDGSYAADAPDSAAVPGTTQFDREFVKKTVPLIQERIKLLSEYAGYVAFLQKRPTEYEMDLSEYKDALKAVAAKLEAVEDWRADVIGDAMLACAAELEMKNSKFFGMLRIAITGKKVSPPLNESMEILGKEECVGRVENLNS